MTVHVAVDYIETLADLRRNIGPRPNVLRLANALVASLQQTCAELAVGIGDPLSMQADEDVARGLVRQVIRMALRQTHKGDPEHTHLAALVEAYDEADALALQCAYGRHEYDAQLAECCDEMAAACERAADAMLANMGDVE